MKNICACVCVFKRTLLIAGNKNSSLTVSCRQEKIQHLVSAHGLVSCVLAFVLPFRKMKSSCCSLVAQCPSEAAHQCQSDICITACFKKAFFHKILLQLWSCAFSYTIFHAVKLRKAMLFLSCSKFSWHLTPALAHFLFFHSYQASTVFRWD